MFLSKDELVTVASDSIVSKLTDLNDFIVSQIISESIALMNSYLAKYYDTAAIFAATGEARNLNILKRLKDIVIYEIYIRHTREPNEVAQSRYDNAISWLASLNTGEFSDASLPPAPAQSDTAIAGDVRFGGNNHFNSIY